MDALVPQRPFQCPENLASHNVISQDSTELLVYFVITEKSLLVSSTPQLNW